MTQKITKRKKLWHWCRKCKKAVWQMIHITEDQLTDFEMGIPLLKAAPQLTSNEAAFILRGAHDDCSAHNTPPSKEVRWPNPPS